VRVAPHRLLVTAFKLKFQLADAAQELIVELMFCEQFMFASLERELREFELFGERSD
jgi:hypothetical protein